MAKVTAKGDLTEGTEFTVVLASKTVALNVAGNILSTASTEGATGDAFFGALSDFWKSDADANKYRFPFAMADGPIGTMLELRGGWLFTSGIDLLRDSGFAYTSDFGGVTKTEEWAGFVQAGTLAADTDQPYYLLGGETAPTDFGVANEFNEAIQIFDTSPSVDNRSGAKFYSREQGKTYGYYDLVVEQSLSATTYRKFLVPMDTTTDSNISASDATIDADSPYTGMTFTVGAVTPTIDGTARDFSAQIAANGGTTIQVYEWWQRQLRKTTDIDAGAGTERGDIYADYFISISGSIATTTTGLYVDNVAAAELSNWVWTDDLGIGRTEPFVPTFTVNSVDGDGAAANFNTGTRLYIYDTTNTTTLYNNTPGAVNTIGVSHSAGGTVSLLVKIIATSGATIASELIKTTSSISTENVSINVVQKDNQKYIDINKDGTDLDTDITINANKIDIDISDANNTIPLPWIYSWTQTYLTTSAGIADSNDLVTALTSTTFVFDDTVEVANTKTGFPLIVTGGYATDASGSPTGWADLTQEMIFMLPPDVRQVTVSSGSGLSVAQDALLTAIGDDTAVMQPQVDSILTDTADIQPKVDDIYTNDGLDSNNPLTITPTSRIAGSVELAITGDGETTTTVTRQP